MSERAQSKTTTSFLRRALAWWQRRCPLEATVFATAGLITMLILTLAGV